MSTLAQVALALPVATPVPAGDPVAEDELRGLDAGEVLERRERDGWNELPATRARGLWVSIAALFAEPMTLLLLGTCRRWPRCSGSRPSVPSTWHCASGWAG